jgi:cell wall-associated NlpC family hydrolase
MNIYSILSRDPLVLPAMLQADYWIERDPQAHQPLNVDHPAYNASVYARLGIPPIVEVPNTYSRQEVLALMEAAAPQGEHYLLADGTPLHPRQHPAWLNAIAAIPPQLTVQFGLATAWTPVRSLPTWEVLMNEALDFPTDYLQETSIDVGWPVAILASVAGWHFGLTPLYWGWWPVDSIALTTREALRAWQARPTVTALSSRALIGVAGLGGATPQLGTSLPLMEEDADSYHIAIPARNAEGHVVEYIGRAAKKASPVSQIGPLLAPTRASLAQSAFELLGERYAWGDSRLGQFGRDCSRLVKDVYASIGITLARNADEQEATLPLAPQQDLQTLQLGDLLFIPGHVMLGLGVVEGIPYVLHAFGRGYKAVVVTSTAPPQAENLMAKRWALCRFGGAQ